METAEKMSNVTKAEQTHLQVKTLTQAFLSQTLKCVKMGIYSEK